MTRRDRQRATPTEENENLFSQEDNPGNHISPREVEKKTLPYLRETNDKEKKIQAVQTFEDNHDKFRYRRKTNKTRRTLGR